MSCLPPRYRAASRPRYSITSVSYTHLIFIGVIYAWVTGESAWPSFVGLMFLAVTTTSYDTVMAAVQAGVKNQNILTCISTLFVAAILATTATGKWLGQWIISRPVLKGRPYLMIATFFAAMWLPLNLSMAGMILIWDVSVSYTHLDVYKRQVITEEKGGKTAYKAQVFIDASGDAVDVYKRQILST